MSPSNSSSNERSKAQFSLPPIRDILGDELTSSTSPRMRPLDATFSLGPLRSALSEGPSPGAGGSRARLPSDSPELGYSNMRQVRAGSSTPYSAQASPRIPSSSTSSYVPPYPPQIPPHRQLSGSNAPIRRTSSAIPLSHTLPHPTADVRRAKSNSHSGYDPVPGGVRHPQGGLKRSHEGGTPTLVSTVDWEAHKRRGSSDSVQSSYSDSSGSSLSAHSMHRPNALQFQPLPHGHFTPPASQHGSHAHYGQYGTAAPPQPPDYHSPFGVLVADMDMAGVPPADPQRMAILRSLRASISQDGFPRGYDDHRNPLPAARYECPYCAKRFSRPSSLKIHINSHTGEKPFLCTFPNCGRRFSVQSNMRRHARVHEQNPRKADESSADELADDDSSAASRASPSTSPVVRPKLPPIDVDVVLSDTDDSSLSKTAHPNTPRPSRVPTSARGQIIASTSTAPGSGTNPCSQKRSKDY